jgi:uncharacterized protein YbbK (DUF523 family)
MVQGIVVIDALILINIFYNNMKVIVSACLLGLNTRYDGKSKKSETLIEYLGVNKIEFYPLCAEQLGGLSTPRPPCEIEKGSSATDVINGKGRVLNKAGIDVTKDFLKGANLVLEFCKEFEITHAILQDRSPSCGYSKVYDGTFTGTLKKGRGILTHLLEDNGITIIENLVEDS